MPRTTLSSSKAFNRGPRALADAIPALSVMAASLLTVLPIVSSTGWWPDWGLLMLVGWRLLRADAWPTWWAAPLGFFNDLMTGGTIGLSVAIWSAIMIVMDIVDRRTQWRDYWIEWGLACIFVAAGETMEWLAASWTGATVPFARSAIPSMLIAMLSFPACSWLVLRIDRWRLRS